MYKGTKYKQEPISPDSHSQIGELTQREGAVTSLNGRVSLGMMMPKGIGLLTDQIRLFRPILLLVASYDDHAKR